MVIIEIYKNLDLNMEGEIWKDAVGYEELYEVSSYGRVKSLNYSGGKKEKIMKQTFTNNGYLTVGLTKDGKTKTFKVHRLVAIAFIPNVENKPYVDHINTIRTDNRVENLRWATRIENMNNELTKEKIKLRKFSDEWRKNMSEAHKGKVVSEETRQKISESKKGKKHTNYKGFVCIFPDGEVTKEMGGKELEEMLGVSDSTIINIAKSNKPYKTSHKRLKHLENIRIYYAEDYLKLESGDKIAQ